MREPAGSLQAAGLLAAWLVVLAAAPVTGPDAGVVDGCASQRLPPDILGGPAAHTRTPLRLVDASAPQAALRLAVAADATAREQGLMCVLQLRPQRGMIFVFPGDNDWEFWMKNTLVPLDMVWLRADGTVTTVAADVPASTRSTADAAVARRRGRGTYVVELRAGEAAADGLAVGTRLALPSLRAVR